METKVKRLTLFAVLIISLLAAGSASSQIIYGQPPEAQTGFIYTTWTIEVTENDKVISETDINQLWFPVSGFVPLRDNLELFVFVATAKSDLESASISNDISGLGDLRLQISQSLGNDKFLLSGGLSLPTGKKDLTANKVLTATDTSVEISQQQVVERLSENFLEFPMRRYGEGFGFSLMAGVADQLGEINVGGGARYEFIGKYDPYEGVTDYDPGDAFSVYAGGDLEKERAFWSANVIFTSYLKDKQGDLETIKQSNQLDFRLSGIFGTTERRLRTFAQFVLRGNNKQFNSGDDVVDLSLKRFGNEFSFVAAYDLKSPSKWYISPLAGVRLIGSSDGEAGEGFGSSNIIKFGGAFGRDFSEQVSAEIGVTYLTGSADGGDVNLSGLQLTGSLSAAF